MLGLHWDEQRLDSEIKSLYLRQCKDSVSETVKNGFGLGLKQTTSLLNSSLSMFGLATQDLQSKHRPQLLKTLCNQNGLSDEGSEEALAKRLMVGMRWDYEQLRCKLDIEWQLRQQGIWSVRHRPPPPLPTEGAEEGTEAEAPAAMTASVEWDYVASCPTTTSLPTPSIEGLKIQGVEDVKTDDVMSPTTSTTSSFDMVSDCDDEDAKGCESPKEASAEEGHTSKEASASRANRSNSEDSIDWTPATSPASSTRAAESQ
jgi:hypothetical protein